jgi:hypothetical protein
MSKMYNEEWRKENGLEGVNAELPVLSDENNYGFEQAAGNDAFVGHVGGG